MRLAPRICWFLLTFLTLSCATTGGKNDSPLKTLPMMQGLTTADSVQITVLSKKNAELRFRIVDPGLGNTIAPIRSEEHVRKHSKWKTNQVQFSGLKPNIDYKFEVYNAITSEVVDRRIVNTLDLKKPIKLAFASCMDDSFAKEQSAMWSRLKGVHPTVFFMIGDNVYGDKNVKFYTGPSTPEILWERYVETWNTLDYYFFDKLIPTLALWDDHDYGKNDGDKNFENKKDSLKTFKAFYPQFFPSDNIDYYGKGITYRYTIAGVPIYLLDSRYYRQPPGSKRYDAHFGYGQEKWLFDWLKKDRSTIALLVKGDQWFGGYHKFESFEGNHPKSFGNFMWNLRKNKIPVLFISGDRHASEVINISNRDVGYETYEIVTSPLHAKTFPRQREKEINPRRRFMNPEDFNFATIEPLDNDTFRVRIEGEKRTFFDEKLKVQKPK